MDMTIFLSRVLETFTANPLQYVETIPSGSGIFHMANVGLDQWSAGFVSTKPGRWNIAGQDSKYFADDLRVCAAELGYTQNNPPSGKVFELYETTREISAINIASLPGDIQQALYKDLGPGPSKWEKTHALLKEIQMVPEYKGITCVYAPSASGLMLGTGGMVFVADPGGPDVTRVGTYDYEEAARLGYL